MNRFARQYNFAESRGLVVLLLVIVSAHQAMQAQYIEWKQAHNPLPGAVEHYEVDDDFVYARVQGNLYRTHLNAGGWRVFKTPFAESTILSFCVSPNLLTVLNSSGRIAQSTDGGGHWTIKTTVAPQGARFLQRSAERILIGLDDGSIVVTQWTDSVWQKSLSPQGMRLTSIFGTPTAFFVLGDSAILRLANGDTLWREFCSIPPILRSTAREIAVNNATVLCSSDSGLYRSVDSGHVWQKVVEVQENSSARVRMRADFGLICCVSGACTQVNPGVVYRSNTWGADWYAVRSFRGRPLEALGYNNEVVVRCDNEHIVDVKPIISDAIDLCATPNLGPISLCAVDARADVVVCDDEALARISGWDVWLPTTKPIVPLNDALIVEGQLIACSQGSDLVYSDDLGLSWFPLATEGLVADIRYDALLRGDSAVYIVAAQGGVFSSRDFVHWTSIEASSRLRCWAQRDRRVAMLDELGQKLYIASYPNTQAMLIQTPISSLQSIALFDEHTLFAIDSGSSTLYTLDIDRATWTSTPIADFPSSARSIHAWHSKLYVLSATQGVYQSSDMGLHWRAQNYGLRDSVPTRIRFRDSTILLGTQSRGLYYAHESNLVTVDVDAEQSDSQARENTFRCYPNPAQNFVNIECGVANCRLDVYTELGELVLSGTVGPKHRLDVELLSNGVYVIVLQDGERLRSSLLSVYH